uniref:Bifunctional NAD(P)H-hydrate repair enzyme Nnr n=1 Tax=Yoonia rhodophyticola TaxID=3137370 RepID=A0AAN0NKY8_9RHOB
MRRAVVLCGPGNNGGDGFVVARLLRDAGWQVEVFLYGDAEKLPPDAKVNHERWVKIAPVTALTEQAFRKVAFADMYVDALFGTGLTRPVAGDLAGLLRHLGGYGGDDYRPRMVAVDVPSGLCADSGRVVTPNPRARVPTATLARLTVTFDSPKCGHFVGDGPHHCGRIVVKDIGVRQFREHKPNPHTGRGHVVRFPRTSLIGKRRMVPDERPFFGVDIRYFTKNQGHKYAHGHAFILSGGVGKGGAARLAARGALRVGAGAVTLGSPPAALIENAAQLNAIMLQSLKDPDAAARAVARHPHQCAVYWARVGTE